MFFKHVPSKDIPNLKPEERSLKEFEKGEDALQSIKEDVEFVMKGKKVRWLSGGSTNFSEVVGYFVSL